MAKENQDMSGFSLIFLWWKMAWRANFRKFSFWTCDLLLMFRFLLLFFLLPMTRWLNYGIESLFYSS